MKNLHEFSFHLFEIRLLSIGSSGRFLVCLSVVALLSSATNICCDACGPDLFSDYHFRLPYCNCLIWFLPHQKPHFHPFVVHPFDHRFEWFDSKAILNLFCAPYELDQKRERCCLIAKQGFLYFGEPPILQFGASRHIRASFGGNPTNFRS